MGNNWCRFFKNFFFYNKPTFYNLQGLWFEDHIMLTWNDVCDDLEKTEIWESVDNGEWVKVNEVNQGSLTGNAYPVLNTTNIRYKVRSINISGLYYDWSEEIIINSPVCYFIDATGGNNGNTGLSPDQAWQTIAKLNTVTPNPGEWVLFKRGEKWEEILYPLGDGIAGNHINYGSYGTGNKPIITGRGKIIGTDVIGNWTETFGGSHIWYFDLTGLGYSGSNPLNRLWLNNTEQVISETLVLISATEPFFFDNGAQRLYFYNNNNPGTLGLFESGNVRSRCLELSNDNYYSFYNIDFQGSYYGIRLTNGTHDLLFDNCNIGLYTPGNGITSGDNTASIDNVEIRYCTFDTGMLIKYEIASFYIPWYGINMTYEADNWNIHHNYFKNWDYAAFAFIWLAGYDCTNLYFHHNEITAPDTYEGKPIGISSPNGSTQYFYNNYMHNVGVGCQMTGVGWKFYSNVIDNVRGAPLFTVVSKSGLIISNNVNSDCSLIEVYNNTICNCSGPGIYLGKNSDATVNENNFFRNNILYNNGTTEAGVQLQIREYAVVNYSTYQYNIIYCTGVPGVVNYKTAIETVAQFLLENGNVEGEIIDHILATDPMLKKGTTPINGELNFLSPAKQYGMYLIIYDILDRLFKNPPSLGAYEIY